MCELETPRGLRHKLIDPPDQSSEEAQDLRGALVLLCSASSVVISGV